MTLDDYRRMRMPGSRWRRDARRVIVGVIEASGDVGPAALLAAVDHAYPFGPRRHEPYKQWLVERRLFRDALADTIAMPSRDEADACEVARDMVLEGRLDDARRALDLAPNRLARRCPACGAPRGKECDEAVEATEILLRREVAKYADDPVGYAASLGHTYVRRALLVPHHARMVGHRDAGPLFTTEAR